MYYGGTEINQDYYKDASRRDFYVANSNNQDNPNKNKCILAVAKHFHVDGRVKYLHVKEDLLNALRQIKNIDPIRTNETCFEKLKGQLKWFGNKVMDESGEIMRRYVIGYIIFNRGHVSFYDHRGDHGNVDTSPSYTHNNPVESVYMVSVYMGLANMDYELYKENDKKHLVG